MNIGTQLSKSGRMNHINSLADIVRDYKGAFWETKAIARGFGSEEWAANEYDDPVVEYCEIAPDLKTAVNRAVDGKRLDGKMFAMDSQIYRSARHNLRRILLAKLPRLAELDDFESLHDYIEFLKPPRIGALTVYNMATRIGAYLGIRAEAYVYLHAGPLKGWKALTGRRDSPKRIPLADLPRPLWALPPHQIEDLFCEYRDHLEKLRHAQKL